MSEMLPMPSSRDEVRAIQSERKKIAFARAQQAPWYKGKLDHIDGDRLDDPDIWAEIPILDKDILRSFDHASFVENFCIAPSDRIAEYWRSGGSTGKPVFYPRTFEDVDYALASWRRSYIATGIGPGDHCHISFPLGIHPAGQIWARSAHEAGVGMNWVGAGNAVPSEAQIDLIMSLRPTVLISMSSFALHLVNVADTNGIDLTESSIHTVICSAETLSDAKREKLSRRWGAKVFDVFGMSEAGLMGAEGNKHDGMHIWTDMFFIEVVDGSTGAPMPEGEVGTLCVTPLYTNHATPFLRWNSGDIVSMHERGESEGRVADLYPMIRHAQRASGFFKIRGVNLNHSEFEDFMFGHAEVNDFQAVMETDSDDLETLRIRIEVKRSEDKDAVAAQVADNVKRVFEMSARVELLDLGTLGADFESSIKAPRFVDQRT